MNKILLSLGTLCIALSANSQITALKLSPGAEIALPSAKIGLTGMEMTQAIATKPQPYAAQLKAINEEIIGQTIYDLQSNSSIQNRNLVYADGTIGAVFTMGALNPSFTDRGAGYNYYSATTWDPIPTARIETTRNGWPSLMLTTAGDEVVISHSGAGGYTLNKRNPKGTGAWTETIVPDSTGHWRLWPRAVSGGASGNSIHVIGITAPTGNGGTFYEGIDGALLYSRSLDGGATWDIVDSILPSLDSTQYNDFRADAYSIIADGDNVAIGVFSQWADMKLLKSADNGSTWTETIVNDFPLDLYITDQPNGSDWTGDFIPDTISTCDESGTIAFDQFGNVHMSFGHMRVLDADLGDGNTSYFPGTQELYYWNESMAAGTFTTIAVPEDIIPDGILDYAGSFSLYYTALCGFPSMGTNADGTIFVAYSGYREDFATATQNYRHIYVVKSMDGGTTWETPLDVTPDLDFNYYEHIFPTMAPMVDDKVRLWYMRDFEPGLAARGDMDLYDDNAIVYLDVDTALFNDAGLNELPDHLVKLSLFPNPTDEVTTLNVSLEKAEYVSVTMNGLAGDKVAFSFQGNLTVGEHSFAIDTHELPTGMYFVNIEIEGKTKTVKLIVSR
jgi:hypothetical protein